MRIVLDTNVVVSGLISDAGAPAQIVDLCLSSDLGLIVDRRIVAEYREVLARAEFGFAPHDVDAFLATLAWAEHVVAAPLPFRLPDRDDEPFLEVAVAGGADALVTGNERHFRLRTGRLAVAILSPRKLLDRLGG
ncbi:MAG TPA: putative toxin-antitoxin system toxin component, PIN family [Gemmatimonadaceae bacterium]|nr:putative toxin-antitoxin system toxin component, PIN family [Gemmatimonadaceae bacterium]